MTDNICFFIPYHKDYQSIHTVNFVMETKPQINDSFRSEAVYKVHYVCSGKGSLHTLGKVQPLFEGDIFFTFAGHPFYIESEENLSYMYISFLGSRANMIMEKLKITPNENLFSECNEICDFWEKAFNINQELTDLISESVLLYTFSFIGNRILEFNKKAYKIEKPFLLAKKYIDDNFTDPALSLSNIGNELKYNTKYISGLFKKKMGIGINEYINTVRIQQACTLINQGLSCVSEISSLSGFKDALYFSKVFKKKMGISPKQYIIHQPQATSLFNIHLKIRSRLMNNE